MIEIDEGIVTAASGSSISEWYYLSTYEANPFSQIEGSFRVRRESGRDMSSYPVVGLSWYGAKAFCEYYGYRLPTEAEWEYAARGGLSAKRFPWGHQITHSKANYQSSSLYSYDISGSRGYHPSWEDGFFPYTSPVGTFVPNGYGLYDVTGNVWEWCNDWYDSRYYDNSPQQDPQGPVTGGDRVIRGGSWYTYANYCRTANRRWSDSSSFFFGFRCALDFQ